MAKGAHREQDAAGQRVPDADPAPRTDPVELWEEARTLRQLADRAEANALRAALEQSGWLVARAAALLGMPSSSSLQSLIGKGRRHAAIGLELEQHRHRAGYTTGRPRKR